MSNLNHKVEPEELMAYLDGELPADQAAETAAHLEQCRDCQKLAAELKEVSEMLVAWQVQETDQAIPNQVCAALDDRHKRPATLASNRKAYGGIVTPRRLLWAGGLALACLLIVAISIPNLLKSKVLPNAANSARARDDAYYNAAAPQLQDGNRVTRGQLQPAAPPKTPKVISPDESEAFTDAQGEMTSEEAEESAADNKVDLKAPMIIRTAELGVTTKEFDKARAALDDILKRHHGHVGNLQVNTPAGAARSMTGTLRVPSNQLDASLADLKGLGRVDSESQNGEEVTQQYVDLQARLANSKHTEQRLTEILRQRTGKLSDVLAVEMQISRVRGEIEQMEAQRKTMKNQVDFATLNLTVTEDYKQELNVAPPSTGTQFHNAAVDGYRSLVDGIIAVLLWLLSVGPTLLLWIAVLFFPVRMAVRKIAAIARDRRHRA